MYLIPLPRKISYDSQRIKEDEAESSPHTAFFLSYDTSLVIDASMTVGRRIALGYAKLLQEEIRVKMGFTPSILQRTAPVQNSVFLTCQRSEEGNGEQAGAEAYGLTISQEGITVEGQGEAGLLYGVQTLRQIIRQCGYRLPLLVIEDAPGIPRRGLSYDVTRGRVPTLEHLKRLADTLSFYKYNQLQLYVEHSYFFEDTGELWRDNDPLTAQEILELDAYCRDLHIELVPALASFGHLYELLRTRKYEHLCELEGASRETYSLVGRMAHHTLDVSNEESFCLVRDRILEFMDLFSSPYFNICADETFDLCKGRSRALGEEKGVREIYLDFLKKLCVLCTEHGKIPMFWGDVLVEQPTLLGQLPEDGICLNWEYAPNVSDKQVKILTEAGVEHLYLCPGVQSWNHLINRQREAYANILGMCANAHHFHVEGVLNTEWGDLGHIAHPEFATLGQIYGAAFSWSAQPMSEEEINRAISVLQYGDRKGEVAELFADLSEQECANWWHVVQYMEEQSGILKKKPGEGLVGILAQDITCGDAEKLLGDRLRENQELIRKLYEKMTDVSEDKRDCLYAYILMGEGQRLLALTGYLLDCERRMQKGEPVEKGEFFAQYGIGGDDKACAQEVAEAWEKWLVRYKALWREESKESELWRITKVICWYADRLRGLEALLK